MEHALAGQRACGAAPRSKVERAAVLLLALGAAGCGEPPVTDAPELRRFDSAHEFNEFLASQLPPSPPSWSEPGWPPLQDDVGPDVIAAPPPPPAPGGAGGASDMAAAQHAPPEPDSFSSTNIQESGVQESDVIQTDGVYLYIINPPDLQIVRAVPAEDMELVSSVKLEGSFSELFLTGEGQAIALGSDYGGQTHVTVVDISDPASSAVEADYELPGSLVASRMIGPVLHVVLDIQPDVQTLREATPPEEASFEEIMPDIKTRLPGKQPEVRDVLRPEDVYRPAAPDGYPITAVASIDARHPTREVQTVAIMAEAQTVYASSGAIYITGLFEAPLPDPQVQEAADQAAVPAAQEATAIYKLELDPDGPAKLVARGSVPGHILNRFSLSEHRGHLRIATTTGHVSRTGDGDAANHLFVLRPRSGVLETVGSIVDIAPTEKIYAARFLGDRGFLVTFKKVDPLFTIDLSDPTEPRLVGELKIPGYSDYIHPLGKDHLLTIGKDAVDMGGFAYYQGVQLSIFDVSDFANPVQVDVEIVGDRGTDSEALTNPHAFNYFAPLGLLAVPMRIAEVDAGEPPYERGDPTFEGLCLYRIDAEEGIEESERISTVPDRVLGFFPHQPWTRGVFIGDRIYVVTDDGVKAIGLGREPSPAGSLQLR